MLSSGTFRRSAEAQRVSALTELRVARTSAFVVRVLSLTTVLRVAYPGAVSRLRRPFLADRYFSIERVATVSAFLTVGFFQARYPSASRT